MGDSNDKIEPTQRKEVTVFVTGYGVSLSSFFSRSQLPHFCVVSLQ
jgi:hypothetical protein